jgi:predicted amidophosphoribosyltransferase
LFRKKNTKAQFGLGRQEREKNLENNFVLSDKYADFIKGKKVLLVDDVANNLHYNQPVLKNFKEI